MTYFKDFLVDQGLENDSGLFVNNLLKTPFEEVYTSLRQREARGFSDQEVSGLPEVHPSHRHRTEWAIRQASARKLTQYLKTRQPRHVVEIGCGNGWLTNVISRSIPCECLGIDACLGELRQAQRVFGVGDRITFAKADVLSSSLASLRVDQIVMAASIQYFEDLKKLLSSALNFLQPSGELHILESPIYSVYELKQARQNSVRYFNSVGCPAMSNYYFHHAWTSLETYNCEVKYRPNALMLKLARWRRKPLSPFPWVIVRPAAY